MTSPPTSQCSPMNMDKSPDCFVDSDYDSNHSNSPTVKDSLEKPGKRWGNCPPDANSLPPCRVCGEKASGLHYGANTCEPCKGFFRRCIVKMKKKEKYKCTKEGKCKLGVGKRMSCSYCRYKKCLEVGMAHDAIKIGRYTHAKRAKNITELKSIQKGVNKDQSDTYVDEKEVDRLVVDLIEIQEECNNDFKRLFQAEGLLAIQRTIYEAFKQKEDIFGTLGALSPSVYEEFYQATGIDIDDRQEKMDRIASHMERYIHTMVKFARALPGFSELSTTDQIALLKANYHEYFFLEFHRRINPELQVVAFGSAAMEVTGHHQDEMRGIIGDDNHIDYIFECATKLQKSKLSVEETTLSRAIMLTYTDQCTLEEPEKVEKIQWHLINCLRCNSKRTHTNPDERLWQIFDKFTLLRSFSNHGRKIDNIKAQWPVMKNHPLVLEFICPDMLSPKQNK